MGLVVALLLAVGAVVALLLYFLGPRADAAAPTTSAARPTRPTTPAGQAAGLLHVVARTDPGLRRKHNEDSHLVVEDRALFVVADGMGRHAAGEVASQLTVDVIRRFFDGTIDTLVTAPDAPPEGERLRAAVLEANQEVFARARDDEACQGMGTTIVGLVFTPERDRVVIVSAGDSRCYRRRGGELRQMTTDHTLGAAGIVGGNAGLLSRAVGIEENLEVDLRVEPCHPGDLYLLCSDGLSRMVSDEITSTVLGKATPLEARAAELIDTANQAGGRDNVTVILVQVNEREQV